METMFKVVRDGQNAVNLILDEETTRRLDSTNNGQRIKKWTRTDHYDPREWAWEIKLVENGSKVVANFLDEGKYVFNAPAMFIGRGIGLILSMRFKGQRGTDDGHYEVRATRIDLSICEMLKHFNVSNVSFRVPTDEAVYEANGMNIVQVKDLDGNEQKSLDGIFTLDPGKPYLLHHRRLVGSRSREWDSIYVPKGYVYQMPKQKSAAYIAPEIEPKVEDGQCAGTLHDSAEQPVAEESNVEKQEVVTTENVAAETAPAEVTTDDSGVTEEKNPTGQEIPVTIG